MYRLLIFVTLTLAAWSGAAPSRPADGNVYTLTPEALFCLIDSGSREVRLQRLLVDEADAAVDVAKASRLPSVTASLSVGFLGNGYVTDRDFSDGMGVRNPHFTNNFAIDAAEIIYSGGAITEGIRMAELKRYMAELNVVSGRQEVRFALLGQLIDLHLLANRTRVLSENLTLANQVLDNMRARFDEGVVLLSDITRYELQVENIKLQIDANDEAVAVTNYRLANALSFDPDATVFIADITPADPDEAIPAPATWRLFAAEHSPALRKAALGSDISRSAYRLAKAERLPVISGFVYGRFEGPITTEVPILDKNIMYWGFGVNVSYNLSSLWTAPRRIRQARAAVYSSLEAEEVAHEQVTDNIEAAYERYLTCLSELRTRQKSLELALQNYDIVAERFENGMALITDMVDAANVRLSAELDLENARTALLFCKYRLQYAAGTL